MGSTQIKQDSSIKEACQECTYDNNIGCLSILLSESENSSLSSASLLTVGSLIKASGTTSASSAMLLLGHKL